MNWYTYFFEKTKGTGVDGIDESFTETHLFIALVQAIAEAKYSTKDDLNDLVRAYNDYKKGVRYDEQFTRTVSAG